MWVHSLTINVNRAVGRASIDEALSCGVHGGEVCPDQSSQHFVASVGHQAVILRMLDQVVPGWILFPSVVPAYCPTVCPAGLTVAANYIDMIQKQPAGYICVNKKQCHC